jgi:hypothetical protein
MIQKLDLSHDLTKASAQCVNLGWSCYGKYAIGIISGKKKLSRNASTETKKLKIQSYILVWNSIKRKFFRHLANTETGKILY